VFGLARWNPFEEFLAMQREFDRIFNQFWNELPTRTAALPETGFRVRAKDEEWQIDVPLPGVDPQHLTLDVSGNTLTIRAAEPGDEKSGEVVRYEQNFVVPPFLDVDRISASHRHGMLHLTLPLKEALKPRRIPISTTGERKQIAA
jgi:HSP20 family protein